MIEKWLGILGRAIVSAFLDWAGVKDLDDLLAKGANAIRAELAEDLDKLDDIPAKIVNDVAAQMNAVTLQFANMAAGIPNQILGQLPDFSRIITDAIKAINPLNLFGPR